MVINGENAVLGRLASRTAKSLLKGEEVSIINAGKIIITGDRKLILNRYLERRRMGSPQHGPFFPKKPDHIVRRTVRGMLPYKTARGRQAMKRLHVYTAAPAGLEAKKEPTEIRTSYVTVAKIAENLGSGSG